MVHPYQRKPKPSIKRPEQVLHRAVGQYLDVALPDGAMWCHYPAGGFRKPVEAAIFKALGVRPGIPDILVIYSGQLYAIELKADRKLTPIQAEMHERLEDCGVPCTVAKTLEEVERFLRAYIPLTASVRF